LHKSGAGGNRTLVQTRKS